VIDVADLADADYFSALLTLVKVVLRKGTSTLGGPWNVSFRPENGVLRQDFGLDPGDY